MTVEQLIEYYETDDGWDVIESRLKSASAAFNEAVANWTTVRNELETIEDGPLKVAKKSELKQLSAIAKAKEKLLEAYQRHNVKTIIKYETPTASGGFRKRRSTTKSRRRASKRRRSTRRN